MADRIQRLFASSADSRPSRFIAYLCAGDPDFETSLALCRILIEEGIDLLELGIPFSDPLADGLTNQLAAQRALESGMTADQSFALVREIRKFAPDLPIVFYTYYNLVFARGEEAYVQAAAEAGVDGLLTLDLPPEEADTLVGHCREAGLANIFIVAPTTPPERLAVIGEKASGFIYYVSREGVTGERKDLPDNLKRSVETIRAGINLPVVVGFGISSAQQVREINAISDGAVVGSALVNCVQAHRGDSVAIQNALREKIRSLLASPV